MSSAAEATCDPRPRHFDHGRSGPESAPIDPGGFTLLEALAAVLTLGLLAATVVPLLRQLGQISLADRAQAQAYLRTLASPDGLAPGTVTVAGHPGWILRIDELIPEPEPAPPPGRPPPAGPPHLWLRVSIQADGGRELLAETLVAVLAPGVAP